jgi:uncharacterized protein (TIGR00369 family)
MNDGRKMNKSIRNNEDQFANGQVSRDLDSSDTREPKTQLDAVNLIKHFPDDTPEEFPAPIGKLLGLMITSSGTGRATVEFEASGRYANPMGTLHGGVLCDLADAAMGVAYSSTLAEGETFTSIELKINFLRPVWKAKLRAEARMVRAGKIVGLIECDIFDERRRLVARASSTCMTLRGRLAEGRQLNAESTRQVSCGESTRDQRHWQRPWFQLLPRQIDADERVLGYLREPHLPRLESRTTRNFANSLCIADQGDVHGSS